MGEAHTVHRAQLGTGTGTQRVTMLTSIQAYLKITTSAASGDWFIQKEGAITMRSVPQLDLSRQYETLREEMLEAVDSIFKTGNVIMGQNVDRLEDEIAAFIGVKHGIGAASGSDALLIALRAMKIEEGDLVITTPYTFFATVSAITRNGGDPVFVDIDPATFNMNLDHVEEILQHHPHRNKIKAIIPVHLFGQTVDLERLEAIREEYGLKILEDAAQSIGSTWQYSDGTRKISGSIGDACILSFFPSKNLGAYGDAGMILTSNDPIAQFCKMYRVHGARQKYVHEVVGINSRLDEIQAAVLRIKLKHLEYYNKKRREIAAQYARLFDRLLPSASRTSINDAPIVYPDVPSDSAHVFHQYVIRVNNGHRDQLRDYLTENRIGTSIYYPIPLHLQRCFRSLGYREGILPVSEQSARETLALPIFPEMTEEEVDYVVTKIAEFFKVNT